MAAPTDRIVSRMQATRQELLARIEGLDEAAFGWRPPEGGWSTRETLAHLVDAERAHRRFVQAVLAGQPVHLEGFDLDRWNEEHVARRAHQSVAEILEALHVERQATLDLLPTIPDDAWERQGDHPALGEVSLVQVIRIIGVHERQHLQEIRQRLATCKMASP
jgi:hypothetical protein